MVALLKRLDHWLWKEESALAPLRHFIQLIYRVIQKFVDDNFKERAQALTYTTLLSLVPLIAISFSILKGFGVHHELIPYMIRAISFLGEDQAEELVSVLINFVENARGAVLGGVGMLVFFYTVVGLMSTIENAFNRIWGVAKCRSLKERIIYYLIVVLLGPVIAFALISLLSNKLIMSLMGGVSIPILSLFIGKAITILGMTLLLTLAYLLITNTRVKLLPALLGALIAANAWYLVGALFTHFVVLSGKQSQIYSGFASVVLFIMWMYLSWLIVLLGNQIAYYLQYPKALATLDESDQVAEPIQVSFTLTPEDYYNRRWRIEGLSTEQIGERHEQ